MPRMSGFEVLQAINERQGSSTSDATEDCLAVVLSVSDHLKDKEKAFSYRWFKEYLVTKTRLKAAFDRWYNGVLPDPTKKRLPN